METLYLTPNNWDLTLDVNGNIAIASSIYAIAQDIASACRVFKQDLYFNQERGIPYLERILGKSGYPLALYKDQLEKTALTVHGVEEAKAIISTSNNRIIIGRIEFKTSTGEQGMIEL